MVHGIEADFLVAVEITDHPLHRQADALVDELLDGGHHFALAPQTLAEFIAIVTDARRMPQPLRLAEAVARAEHWWQAEEVVPIFPDRGAVADFLRWMRDYQLGRERLLDTLLAASFRHAGVDRIIAKQEGGYAVVN